MNQTISDLLLSRLSQHITAQLGLHFPRERWRDLAEAIGAAAREFGFQEAVACIRWLLSSPLTTSQTQILASYLTIGETYFFRERKGLAVLEEQILPELIRARRGTEPRLRIWSAGCCTGEEPYSTAILLNTLIPDLQDWNLTLLATDVNPRFLQKASEGVYTERSLRDTPVWITERYFKRTQEGRFAILPHIKNMVTFAYLNLADATDPALLNPTDAMDVIFCRNVLMYFAPEQAKKVVDNLYRSLVDGGWLIVGPSETARGLFSRFVTVSFPGATLYKKDSTRPQTGEVPLYKLVEEPEASAQPPTEAAEKNVVLVAQNQGDAKALALLARAYANQGNLAEALVWCEKAIAADKLNPGCHYLLAAILQERGQVEDAARSLQRTLYLDQNSVLAHFTLANLNQRQGKSKESEKHFENALRLLRDYRQDEILPESEGMTAGGLREIIRWRSTS